MDYLKRRAQSFLFNTKKEAAAWEYRNGEARLRTQLKHFGRESNPIMIFTFKDILLMTNNFSDILVRDSTGYLYKGTTLGGRSVVVKKPNSNHHDDAQERFTNSIVVHSNMNHKNVVKLIGCCLETQSPIPVFDFSFNGETLDDRMHHPESMSWKNRLRIAAEIADGLNYMHIGAPVPFIHRDIKPKNVILDETALGGQLAHLKSGTVIAKDIALMTDNYNKSNLIDDTDSNNKVGELRKLVSLYKGALNGRPVVVRKHDSPWFYDTRETIINSIVTLSNVNHKNVFKILGCCSETEPPIVVYDLSPNGVLLDHLFGVKGHPKMS
ncbi:putative wall-associated receptor kinase-like 16 [Acorus calamus]|uniref:Wall-associated receptor kinase-like 16 n=1 Tax=Acorus calamus TaxID=4465 RepID=A0AAV9C013_ACOCL|nr:putative wall-associated receptor kinase-like 16 [Acorus calamus]